MAPLYLFVSVRHVPKHAKYGPEIHSIAGAEPSDAVSTRNPGPASPKYPSQKSKSQKLVKIARMGHAQTRIIPSTGGQFKPWTTSRATAPGGAHASRQARWRRSILQRGGHANVLMTPAVFSVHVFAQEVAPAYAANEICKLAHGRSWLTCLPVLPRARRAQRRLDRRMLKPVRQESLIDT
jgi:hypothetical protein